MQRFLLRLTLFLLPLGLITAVAETYVRHIPNSYRIKQQLLDNMADSIETIILGNSHAYSAIRPELLTGIAVNLANVSQTTNLDLELLQRCVSCCPALRNVVVVFDNSNLCDLHMEDTDERFRITYYTLYMNRLGGHNPYLSRYGLELLNPKSFMAKIRKWHQQGTPDCTSLGWDTDNTSAIRTTMEAEAVQTQSIATWDSLRTAATLKRHSIRNKAVVMQNIRDLQEMARLCQQNGIRLTILCTPVRPDYAAGIPTRQLHLIRQAHNTCCQRYGASSLNLSRDTSFTSTDYFDPDHLTDIGAVKFTKILNQHLISHHKKQ